MKMLSIMGLVAAAVLLAAPAPAQRPFGDGFEQGQLTDYLSRPGNAKGITLAPADGARGKCLQFARGQQGSYPFVAVPVEPETKYQFSFLAKVDGDDVIEKNSRLDVIQVAGGSLLPHWQVQFLAADGKLTGTTRGYGHMALVSGTWRSYTDVFYTPASAAAVQIALVLPNGENGVLLDELTFGRCPDEGAINCNPDFRYGACSYTGWVSLNTGALLVALGNGKYGLDTAYGSSSEWFPLREPGTYRLSAKGTTRGGFRTVDLRLYDANGALIKTRNVVALPDGNSVDFLLPEGTISGSLLVYNHILEEVRVVRMGDASKLAELDAARAAAANKK